VSIKYTFWPNAQIFGDALTLCGCAQVGGGKRLLLIIRRRKLVEAARKCAVAHVYLENSRQFCANHLLRSGVLIGAGCPSFNNGLADGPLEALLILNRDGVAIHGDDLHVRDARQKVAGRELAHVALWGRHLGWNGGGARNGI
jgi:hypothetical protein